jgi:hypothetical protein
MNEISKESRKRNVAYKLRISDILNGKKVAEEGRFICLELREKRVVRVNLLANCIEKYISEGEKKFGSLTIDDASGQIRIKVFGEDISMFSEITQGDTLQIIGNVREWNDELYILPEVLKKVDPRWLLVRKLEIQNLRKDLSPEVAGGELEFRGKVLSKIKDAEVDGGIDIDTIIMNIEASPDSINKEIKGLLEEGLIYEPRPGRLRYLG